jgi:hypothetical protein
MFKVEDMCGNLFGLDVSNIIKFKHEDTERSQIVDEVFPFFEFLK